MNFPLPVRSGRGRWLLLGGLAGLLATTLLLGLRCGALALDWATLLDALQGRASGPVNQIVGNIRLPRVILGALVGAALAVSGSLLQGVMRNPLASPGIIGVSAGGGLAGVLVLLAFPQWAVLLVPAAFVGALATVLLVYLLAWRRGVNAVRLILAGVAVSSMLGAWSSMILLFHAEKAGSVLDFTIGSLGDRSWTEVRMVAGYMAVALGAALALSGRLNVLVLGDEVATALGMRVERVRFALLAVAALLAAAAVSVAGLLGFVGLIAPHMVRMLLGHDYRFVLPGAALFGAALVVGCDTLGKVLLQPGELPVGVIMALLGPPFFLYLLRRRSDEA